MALTTEQETEILTRLGQGERPRNILDSMDISNVDLKAFQLSNRQAYRAARKSKTARLLKLNQKRRRTVERRVAAKAKLDALDAEIAVVEAEEE